MSEQETDNLVFLMDIVFIFIIVGIAILFLLADNMIWFYATIVAGWLNGVRLHMQASWIRFKIFNMLKKGVQRE